MNPHHKAPLQTAAEQVTNNATSWIGHSPVDHKEIISGQTFTATKEGDLEKIEIFSSIVSNPGQVKLTIYDFDSEKRHWGTALSTASVNFEKSNVGRWIEFPLNGIHINKNKTYGFKLESREALIGVGEAAGSFNQPPFRSGQEWKFINNSTTGDAYSYFSLAFKVDIRA